jgi:hypothetical protein
LQTPHLQDGTLRPAMVSPRRLPAAAYRASGLVPWHKADIAETFHVCPLSGKADIGERLHTNHDL